MILGDRVSPCEGEVLIKSYLCTEFNSSIFGIKAKGYLEVTNRRLLFQALGKSMNSWSVIHNEVAIGDVSEIKIYKGSSFNLITFIIGVILSIVLAGMLKTVMMYSFRMEGSSTLFALAGLIFAIWWLYNRCRTEAFSLVINTKGSSGNVVYLAGLSPFAVAGSAASKALVAAPGQDSGLVTKEIGALILDVQNMGENAIAKWQAKTN